MKRTLTVIAIAALLVVMAGAAWAVPAKPGPRVLSQPDGSTFIGKVIGDEHFSFAETMDGNSIIRNSDGWWTYARQEDGILKAGSVVVGRGECPYQPHLRPNAEAVAKLPGNEHKEINRTAAERAETAMEFLYGKGGTKEHRSKAAGGRQYVNVLLGDFTDSTFAWYSNRQRLNSNPYGPFPFGVNTADDQAANLRWFNFLAIGDSSSPFTPDSSAVGSMSNFYWDFTYNKMFWYGTVAYGSGGRTRANSHTGTSPNTTYLQNVVTACDASVNYYQGGSMNNLMVVHPGPGQEESADAADIWSMSMSGLMLTSAEGTITKCIAVPQNAQLGVFCHEMFHQVGGPDLYDYGYSGTPYGEWSLMDNGSWNGIVNGGDAPAFPGAFLTYDINGMLQTGIDGWLTQTDSISSARWGDGKYTICALDSAGEARRGSTTSGIRLWRVRNNNFRDSGQVWLVELRRRTPPYEIGLPEDGLIITHIDTRMGGGTRFNDGPPTVRYYYAWVEQPGFNPNPMYAISDSAGYTRSPSNACYSADDVSPGGYSENHIDSTSIPNSWINASSNNASDAKTGPWIYDVSREGPVMTFNVLRTGLASTNPLINFQTATVLDPVTANTANNNNGLLDPWETDSIKVTFLNSGTTGITAGAQCSLYVVQGSQYISFTPGWQAVGGGAVGAGAQAVSAPFVVTVSQNTPRFLDIGFAVKFTSTTPAVTDTSYFTLRVSPFQVVFTYDFANIGVGGTTYGYRLQPSDLAIYRDTLFVANADLNHTTWYTRIHKVKKNTTNNPLVGGVGGDTISSLPNRGATYDANKYLGGIDVDNAGNLWYSVQDSCFNVTRATPTPTVMKKFVFPNVAWGGTPMRRVRGVALGPSVVDTVGGSVNIPGDSLWGYWQNYFDAAAAGSGAESLFVYQKVNTGTASTIRYRRGFRDSAWGATSYGGANGYSWWNGRALEYDGQNLWSSSVWQNIMIRRTVDSARITMVMPGPSQFGSYGTYGIAHEATDAAGVPYAPVGTVAYAPYARGTIHYLYCASMDEGKIYKILATDFFVPTPCDSVRATAMSATVNKVKFWKHNADTQKVQGYIIYRRADANPPNPVADSFGFVQSSRVGSKVAGVDSFMDNTAKSKAMWYYTVLPRNYGGLSGYGASVVASPLAIELTDFSCALVSGNRVTLRWVTASETNISNWSIERSTDGVTYTPIASLIGNGPSPISQKYSYTDNLPEPGMYYYQLVESGKRYGPLVVTYGAPAVYALGQNFPNPMGTGATTIRYALKAPGQTSLKVYNVMGEAVRTLVNQHQAANYYTVHWDGRDEAGKDVSNGVYFFKLTSGDFNSTKKMMVLK